MAFEYRILIIPDLEPYMHGDPDNAAEVARTNRMINLHGVWGFGVEKREIQGHLHSDWEHVDSCFGFIGNDHAYMLEQAVDSLPDGLKDIPVFETDPDGRRLTEIRRLDSAK